MTCLEYLRDILMKQGKMEVNKIKKQKINYKLANEEIRETLKQTAKKEIESKQLNWFGHGTK